MNIEPIAYIRTDFPEKFGIPRQSGLASSLRGRIEFADRFRSRDAVRGLDGFSHLWLIWGFSGNRTVEWQPTVRPPRLVGNGHMGVFATRSPFRPNPIGLSCVEIESVLTDITNGPVIVVRGADLMDMTPIYDIKPYVRYADCRPHAVCGYVDRLPDERLKVVFPEAMSGRIGDKTVIPSLIEVLKLDPRPSYHNDPEREYGLSFAGHNVRFRVVEDVLEVIDVERIK